MMTTIDTLVAAIRARFAASGLSRRACAISAGLHPNSLRDIHSSSWAPTLDTLRKLEAFLLTPPPQPLPETVAPAHAGVKVPFQDRHKTKGEGRKKRTP